MHATTKHILALPFPNALRPIGDAQTCWHTTRLWRPSDGLNRSRSQLVGISDIAGIRARWKISDDHVIAGRAVRIAAPVEKSGVYHSGGSFSGSRRRREYCDLQHCECGFVALSSL